MKIHADKEHSANGAGVVPLTRTRHRRHRSTKWGPVLRVVLGTILVAALSLAGTGIGGR